jgi:signal transduction histidine kinase
VDADAERVVVTVRDTGEGIAPEHLPYVCERFYRVDASRTRARGGTGLGLAICKSIAQAHGGDLHVESELGHGTAVTLALRPAVLAPQPEAAGMAGR